MEDACICMPEGESAQQWNNVCHQLLSPGDGYTSSSCSEGRQLNTSSFACSTPGVAAPELELKENDSINRLHLCTGPLRVAPRTLAALVSLSHNLLQVFITSTYKYFSLWQLNLGLEKFDMRLGPLALSEEPSTGEIYLSVFNGHKQVINEPVLLFTIPHPSLKVVSSVHL